jgi:hypothetical protein
MLHGMRLQTTVEKGWLLEKLKANREQHGTCYREALDGYLAMAQKKLRAAMKKLKNGEAIVLQFNLHVPEDHTRDYDTVIAMLEAHTESTLTLNSNEFRMFVEDEWDWSDHWLLSNAAYSGTSADLARRKGLM